MKEVDVNIKVMDEEKREEGWNLTVEESRSGAKVT
jgi:hypothetical protein